LTPPPPLVLPITNPLTKYTIINSIAARKENPTHSKDDTV